MPLTEEQKASPLYMEGVSCPKCHDQLTEEKKQRFAERQKQMALAAARHEPHLGVPTEVQIAAKKRTG